MPTPTLKIKVTLDGETRVIEIPKSSATLGSAAHCDVRLEHASLEPEHARAWREGGRLWVQDLGSPSGTFLNGNRLPAMKPMLVRDLDGLKLGETRETLGFDKAAGESVRAPRVNNASTLEHTLTEIRPQPASPASPPAVALPVVDDARLRDERGRVSRELAELRLQLQMAQLEKTSATELRAELNTLRADLNRCEDERRDFKLTLQRNREAEAQREAEVSAELTERRATTQRELTELRERQNRKYAKMKSDLVNELTVRVRNWTTERGFPREVMQSFDAVMGGVLTRSTDQTQKTSTNVTSMTRSHLANPIAPPRVNARRAASRKTVLVGLAAAVLAGGGAWLTLNLKNGGGARGPASLFRPHQDREARPAHTENVIYVEGYVELIRGPNWQRVRGAELAKAPWNFDQPTIRALLSREANLVRDLSAIFERTKEGREQDAVTAMHSREAEYVRALLVSFQNDQALYDRFAASGVATLQRLLKR